MFRRGFKSQCERKAVEIRKSLDLAPISPLSATDYACKLGITLWKERDVRELGQEDLFQLTHQDPESWSAFVLRIRQRYLIVYNSAQSRPRINSVIMHEIAHITLGHELTSAGLSADGHLIPTVYDQSQEDEANWLAGTLLLPRPALLDMRREGLSDQDAMHHFLVSEDMLTWRLRMTGVDYQMANARRRRYA